MSLFSKREHEREIHSEESSERFVEPRKVIADALFGDDNTDPWLPSRQTQLRATKISALLDDQDLPIEYLDLYNTVVDGNNLSLTRFRHVLVSSGITNHEIETIVSIVLSKNDGASSGVSRAEFNVACALIGLAQEHEEISIDMVDDRKAHLPVPKLNTELLVKKGAKASEVRGSEVRRSVVPQIERPRDENEPASTETLSNAVNPWERNSIAPAGVELQRDKDNRVSAQTARQVSTSPDIHANPIIIKTLPEKQGLPGWKHVNYS